MAAETETQTSTTLLRQLRDNPLDGAAWDRFVERYGLLVYRWCRHWGLQEADADDVSQNVLVELLRQMRSFTYDPSGSFRAWLRTVAYRGWCRFVQARQKVGATGSAAIEAVRTTTGIRLNSSWLLTSASTSRPSQPGRPRSNRIKSGRGARA